MYTAEIFPSYSLDDNVVFTSLNTIDHFVFVQDIQTNSFSKQTKKVLVSQQMVLQL